MLFANVTAFVASPGAGIAARCTTASTPSWRAAAPGGGSTGPPARQLPSDHRRLARAPTAVDNPEPSMTVLDHSPRSTWTPRMYRRHEIVTTGGMQAVLDIGTTLRASGFPVRDFKVDVQDGVPYSS